MDVRRDDSMYASRSSPSYRTEWPSFTKRGPSPWRRHFCRVRTLIPSRSAASRSFTSRVMACGYRKTRAARRSLLGSHGSVVGSMTGYRWRGLAANEPPSDHAVMRGHSPSTTLPCYAIRFGLLTRCVHGPARSSSPEQSRLLTPMRDPNGVQEVAGSNPAGPTNASSATLRDGRIPARLASGERATGSPASDCRARRAGRRRPRRTRCSRTRAPCGGRCGGSRPRCAGSSRSRRVPRSRRCAPSSGAGL